jgi:general secretion pathway protein K
MLSGRINSLKNQGKRGSVIVLVLVFVVLLTFIVVAFLEDATSKIKYYGLFHNRDDLRTDAYSALEISLAIINQYREVEGALWGPAQGWADPLGKFGFKPRHAREVRVSFEDESAKFGLQNLDYDTLLALFEVLGFDLPERESLADGLLDWMDEDDEHRLNGTDGEDYEDMDPPYRPANAPIETWDEFKLIVPYNTLFFDETGAPVPQWEQFRQAVSLYHTGDPNINQASPTILALLQERGALNMLSFMDYKNGADGEPGTEDDRLIRDNAQGFLNTEGGVSTEVQLLRVKVDAIRGDAAFTVEVLVSWSGSDAGAADARSADRETSRNRTPEDSNPNSARDQRSRARGNTRTAPSVAAELGYPFRFLRITENRKF